MPSLFRRGRYLFVRLIVNFFLEKIASLRVVVPPEIEPTDSGSNDVMTSEGNSIKLGCRAKGLN